ncbi:uncharacterized protein SPAPADRAFT_48633 [Spathaspora passalidarum NRRL Y-27907]|uniref:Extracellular membrane protein CFEM domain-containing protein n=1 Tax=Spathaspora passalidarum (strain NRRL Y-27907 / 11-Y1) TaxID=619300 RepID=G3AEN6_SPAPN|nr:uncharacterized protein SPAPADRAFT_48633 [Spathaspora passalidarum NRRL Y-27907]EGW35662.1 hypothetical protein SPAPADRAFT_48633 [Spathaspora passalidarum NRRL Y-27907]
MKLGTTILATSVTLVCATEIHEFNAVNFAKILKRDSCSICESAGTKLEKCFPNFPNYDTLEVAKCVCKFDDQFFKDYINCVTDCDEFQISLPVEVDDPKELKSLICQAAGSFTSGSDDSAAAEVKSAINTAIKNGASTVGVSFLALLGISLI